MDSVLRIRSDTAQGEAGITRTAKAMDVVSKRSAPALGAAFGSMSGQVLSMTTGLSGLSGVLSMVGQSMLLLSPAMAAAAIAAAAVTGIIIKNKDAFRENTATIAANRGALDELAKSTAPYAAEARALLALRDTEAKQDLARAQRALTMAKHGQREATLLERLTGSMKWVNMETAEQAKLVTELTLKVAALNKELGVFSEGEKRAADLLKGIGTAGPMSAADANEKLTAQRIALNEANDTALAQAVAAHLNEQTASTQKLLDIERQRAQLRAQTVSETDASAIVKASEAVIAAEQAAHMERLANANAFTGERQVLEAGFTLFVEGEMARRTKALDNAQKQQNKLLKNSIDFQVTAYSVAGGAFERAIRGQMAQHGGFTAFMVQTVGEAVQATLKAYGALWAAEAAANTLTNPAVAATKARAAAMAGIAVGVVGALTDVAVSSITSQSERAQQDEAQATGSGVRTTSRATVSTGPVNIFNNVSMSVYGHVFDIVAIRTMLDGILMEMERRAGYGASVRARG